MPATLGLFSGVVLAGGHSTRMGREKATLDVSGTPLWRRQLDLITSLSASEKWIAMRADQNWLPLGMPRVNDPHPDQGPMGAVAYSLQRARYDHLAVLAVDLPAMTAQWYRRLGQRCADGIGVVGQHADGKFEPLAAIYPKKLSAKMSAAVAEGNLSLQTFLVGAIEDGLMRAEDIRPDDVPLFTNWNEPA
ncbi:molybdenum cofactor guanylyltransferase [Nibricoccus sp. IMCC34717]|uniref:molybdenum cofactor guanylyltransferase n=1 Tax=Nibricoccus sp. IMCC34717 TaxID=3034021 RepID=UPI00385068F2